MKKLLLIAIASLALFSCVNEQEKAKELKKRREKAATEYLTKHFGSAIGERVVSVTEGKFPMNGFYISCLMEYLDANTQRERERVFDGLYSTITKEKLKDYLVKPLLNLYHYGYTENLIVNKNNDLPILVAQLSSDSGYYYVGLFYSLYDYEFKNGEIDIYDNTLSISKRLVNSNNLKYLMED